MQSVPITTDVVSSNLYRGEMYNIRFAKCICSCGTRSLWLASLVLIADFYAKKQKDVLQSASFICKYSTI
jgi:hypothetical protein